MRGKRIVFGEEMWYDGLQKSCKYTENGLQLDFAKDNKVMFFAKGLDSFEKESTWSHFKINLPTNDLAICQVYLFASDTKMVDVLDTEKDLDVFLADETYDFAEKAALFKFIHTKMFENVEQFSLQGLKGRYLWFFLEVTALSNVSMHISQLEIQFPLMSTAEYLPSIYRVDPGGTGFLPRFLGIYEAIFYELQEDVERISRLLDLDFAKGENLQWLSKWVGGEISSNIEDGKWKQFIQNAFRLYQKKGTKTALLEVLQLFFGAEVSIVENADILEFYRKNKRESEAKRLYSEDKYQFFVFLPAEVVKHAEQLELARELVEIFKPAYTNPSLVVLQDATVLGVHTYLGMNSRIENNQNLVLIENRSIPFDSTIID